MKSLRSLDPSLENIEVTEKGEVYNTKTNKKLKQYTRKSKGMEYLAISVYDKVKKRSKSFYVHRLVAYLYCDGYSENRVVEHLDDDKMNNHASNLHWIQSGQKRPRVETIERVEEITHLPNGMTVMPTEEWNKIKKYITVLTNQIRYNNVQDTRI